MRARILTILLLLFFFPSNAQNEYRAGIMPEINLNKKWAEKWRINFKVESRILHSEGYFDSAQTHQLNYLLSDISAIGSYQTGLNSKIAFGYLLRVTTAGVIHRAIQQYSVVQGLRKGRLGHRFVLDETFSAKRPPQFRFRYRIAFDLPLQGLQVDSKEFYLKVSNEYLSIFKNRTFDLETRIVPALGFAFNDRNKIELGLDYRFKSILREQTHDFWTTVSWFFSF